MRIFGMRVEAELQRIDAEQERAALIQQLRHALDRLDRQHQLTRRANAFKTEMLGMVAHDLRNPLSAIVGRAELIEQLFEVERGRGEAPRAGAERVHGHRPGRRPHGGHDRRPAEVGARGGAGDYRCGAPRSTSARQCGLRSASTSARQRPKASALPLVADDGAMILADADRLIEAVDNLSATPSSIRRPAARCWWRRGIEHGAGLARISVADRGHGMSESDIAQAFQRFQQLSAKPTAGESSTGLGLAIVRAIAEAHGGSVEATSPGKGLGSTFTLRLPPSGPRPA